MAQREIQAHRKSRPAASDNRRQAGRSRRLSACPRARRGRSPPTIPAILRPRRRTRLQGGFETPQGRQRHRHRHRCRHRPGRPSGVRSSPSSTTTCRSCSIPCSAKSPRPPASRSSSPTRSSSCGMASRRRGDPRRRRSAKDAGADRVSVIHVHIKRLSDDEAAGLKRAAGQGASPGARGGQRLEADAGAARPAPFPDFRYAPVPLDKDAVTEAIAFLEWLRDNNFTFLGMREFRYSGGEKSGTLTRAHARASASLPIRTCWCCAAHRSGDDDARNPRLPAWARSADRHQGERQVGGAPPHLSRLYRGQDLRQERRAVPAN